MPRRVPNPYRPGFNQAPLALAGREDVESAIDEALDVAALDGRTPRPLILTGSRGVGKTVLLGESAVHAAERYGWLTVPVEVRPQGAFVPQLIDRLAVARDLYRQQLSGKQVTVTAAKVRASVLGVGGEVEIQRREAGSPPALPLDASLAATCEAAMERDAGLVVTIDEVQLASRAELGDLAATLQQHVPDGWPLVVVLAGLPSIRSVHRGVTYFERAEWHVLSMLDQAASEMALRVPAEESGRPMAASAARLLAQASGGYPYAIQLLGHHAWRASTGSATIERRHADPAISAAQEELAAGLYSARWGDSSPREREYLEVLAQLSLGHDRVTGGMVAAALGKPAKALSPVRDRLIQKGAIYAESQVVRFAVPGMASWVRDQLSSTGEESR